MRVRDLKAVIISSDRILNFETKDGNDAVKSSIFPSDCAGPVSLALPEARGRSVEPGTALLHYVARHHVLTGNDRVKKVVEKKMIRLKQGQVGQ